MSYSYVAVGDHPDNAVVLSVGQQAEVYAFSHYRGSLQRGLTTMDMEPDKPERSSSSGSSTALMLLTNSDLTSIHWSCRFN